MYLTRLGARRQIRHRLHTPGVRARLAALTGEEVPDVPHGDTIDDYLAALDPAALQTVAPSLVRDLLTARRLEPFRLLDRQYLVTLDMTGHLALGDTPSPFTAGCLTQTAADGRTLYYRPVVEAKLVTRTGLALSLGSEFVENPLGPPPAVQNSELPAAHALLRRVHAAFPALPVCALLDSRYANEPTFALCDALHWRFLITLQEGSIPSVWQEFQTLRTLTSEPRRRVVVDHVVYDYAWVNDIAYGDRPLNVLECRWARPGGATGVFVWVTDLAITPATCHPLAQDGGRQRWRTENEGFRTQKHAGFAMEHAYAKRPTAAKNFYLLLQIAHLLSQMLEVAYRGKAHVKRTFGSLRNLAHDLLEAFRRDPIPDPDTLRPFLETPIQVRLNTS